MKTYKIARSYWIPIVIVLVSIRAIISFSGIKTSLTLWQTWFDLAIWSLLSVWLVYSYFFKRPYEISIHDNQTVEFKGIFKRETISIQKIQSIESWWSHRSMPVDVKMDKGRIVIPGRFDGFEEFLTMLKTINPAIVTKGC